MELYRYLHREHSELMDLYLNQGLQAADGITLGISIHELPVLKELPRYLHRELLELMELPRYLNQGLQIADGII